MTAPKWPGILGLLLMLFLTSPASAGWWEVQVADADLNLSRARRAALETIKNDPNQVDRIAVANWWYDNLDNLADPGEILDHGAGGNVEVSFCLGRIAAELGAVPPAGALSEFDLSGPWGIYGELDLARGAVPEDRELPSVGTPWQGPGTHYRYTIRSDNGWAGVPPSLQRRGVAIAGWTVNATEPLNGWLSVEAEGGLRLSVDGADVHSVPYAGLDGREILWFRLDWAAGPHRIRLALAPMEAAAARLTLLKVDGTPASIERMSAVDRQWAPSTTIAGEPTRPPSSGTGTVPELLLAAELANFRGDTPQQRKLLESALAVAPENAMVHLAFAAFYLLESTGAAQEVDFRRTKEHLQQCADLPVAPLVEHLLAQRQGRTEDLDRLQESLTSGDVSDPRILQLKMVRAIHNGWARVAETTLADLEARLGETESLFRWRLDVLEHLEDWPARRAALYRLAESPPRRRNINLLADGCNTDLAVDLVHQLRLRITDPDLDADLIRLLLRADRMKEARKELSAAVEHWGPLPTLWGLQLMLAEEEGGAYDSALMAAVNLRPYDLDLRGLAWRRGLIRPFWKDYRVDGLEFARRATTSEEGVDSVLLLDQAVEKVFDDGSSLYYYHGLSKALTVAGARRAGTLEQMPGAFRLTLRIIKPDGRIVAPADLSTDGSRIVLGEVEPGDLVEEEYVASVTPTVPAIRGHLSPYIYRFADSTRVFGLSEYVIEAPADLELQLDGRFTGLEFEESSTADLHILRWRAKDVPAVPEEPFAPPTQELLPWVTYSFRMGWNEVGDLLRDRLIGSLRSSPELDILATTHLDPAEPIASLQSLVAAIVAAVEPGPTLLDLATTAGESFTRGQGNRLGVLAGALGAAGWSADLVLTRPAPFAGTHLQVPSMDVFGIPLLRVHSRDREIWIDLRQAAAGVDYLSPSLQGSDGLALPLDDPGAAVHLVPSLPSFANPQLEERSALEVVLDPEGGGMLRFRTWLLDAQASRFTENMKAVPDDKKDMVYGRLASSSFPGAEGVTGTLEEGDSSVEISLDFRLPDACEGDGSRWTCPSLTAASPLAPVLASLPSRRFPLVLQQPILRRLERLITPPSGWTQPASSRRLETRWGSVMETLVPEGSGIRSILVLEIHAVTIAPDDYPEFARFCRVVDELVGRPPVLERATGGRAGSGRPVNSSEARWNE